MARMEDLPADLIMAIMRKLPVRSLQRLRATCRDHRNIGRHCRIWGCLREVHGLPPPRPKAIKYKTDFDRVLPILCRVCWVQKYTSYHGQPLWICRHCADWNLNTALGSVYRFENRLRIMQRNVESSKKALEVAKQAKTLAVRQLLRP